MILTADRQVARGEINRHLVLRLLQNASDVATLRCVSLAATTRQERQRCGTVFVRDPVSIPGAENWRSTVMECALNGPSQKMMATNVQLFCVLAQPSHGGHNVLAQWWRHDHGPTGAGAQVTTRAGTMSVDHRWRWCDVHVHWRCRRDHDQCWRDVHVRRRCLAAIPSGAGAQYSPNGVGAAITASSGTGAARGNDPYLDAGPVCDKTSQESITITTVCLEANRDKSATVVCIKATRGKTAWNATHMAGSQIVTSRLLRRQTAWMSTFMAVAVPPLAHLLRSLQKLVIGTLHHDGCSKCGWRNRRRPEWLRPAA